MSLNDRDIRTCLYAAIGDYFKNDASTRLVDEMQICNGVARIDVAAINGSLHGYEIKSERDTLERLPGQAAEYNKVFDYIYCVCAQKYLEKMTSLVPLWWGVYAVENRSGNAHLTLARPPERNRCLDAFSLLQFLNKDELVLLGIQKALGTKSALTKSPKYLLWESFSELLDVETISEYVRVTMKAREAWRTRSP